MIKKYSLFTLSFTMAHVFTYYIIGAIAYFLLTKQFYTGEVPTFIFMRTESNPESWSHVMRWMLPGQILRGILMALPLLFFYRQLINFPIVKRSLCITLIYFIYAHISAAGPTTSNIEGFIYFKPEFLTAKIFLLTQPEIILQALGLGFVFSGILSIPIIKRNIK